MAGLSLGWGRALESYAGEGTPGGGAPQSHPKIEESHRYGGASQSKVETLMVIIETEPR